MFARTFFFFAQDGLIPNFMMKDVKHSVGYIPLLMFLEHFFFFFAAT